MLDTGSTSPNQTLQAAWNNTVSGNWLVVISARLKFEHTLKGECDDQTYSIGCG
jgi:hypothetical protein